LGAAVQKFVARERKRSAERRLQFAEKEEKLFREELTQIDTSVDPNQRLAM
jgi:hypothetical protein